MRLKDCNGHSVLARQMSKRNIEYGVLDNAFGWIADLDQAQKLVDEFRVEMLHRKLDLRAVSNRVSSASGNRETSLC
jgi:hypothetical protein